MPEGPSIVILKELAAPLFERKKVIAVTGNTRVEKERALGQTVVAFKSWGKHFLICFPTFTITLIFSNGKGPMFSGSIGSPTPKQHVRAAKSHS